MRVLLINPPSSGVFATFGLVLPPLGLLYIAASLEQAGHSVVVKDLQTGAHALTPDDVRGADVVGITSDTTRVEKALRLARFAASFGKTVVMGGPHPQFVPEEIMGAGHVSYIVRGEGEIVFCRLVAALEHDEDPAGVAGIMYTADGRTVTTAPAEAPDITELPWPARHLVDLHRYPVTLNGRPMTPVVTSRGCPSACSFCSSSRFFGAGWRSRSAESVLAEIEEVYHRYGFRAVAFVDDNFTLCPERVTAIAEGISARGLDLSWWNFSRVDTIVKNPAMVKAMAAAGCRMVYLGIESGSDATLDALGKKGAVADAARAVTMLQGRGIEVYGSYIMGGLTERREDVERTTALALQLDTDVAQFSVLTPYPGTPLYEALKERIFIKRWKFFDGLHLVFRHPHMNRHLLQALHISAYLRFYCRRRRATGDGSPGSRFRRIGLRKTLAGVWDLFF